MDNAAAPPVSMDHVYRYQRHIYDVTRRYYLLGRIEMIEQLAPRRGGTILEIGCGTAWNLIRAAECYPSTRCFGADTSKAMLETASGRVKAAGFEKRIELVEANAETFDPADTFGRAAFDRVFMSYALSMIPGWKEALLRAVLALAPGGSLHIVDFGSCEGLPRAGKTMLYAWLSQFHVTPRPDLKVELATLAAEHDLKFAFRSLNGGYAVHAVLGPETTGDKLSNGRDFAS